uniref:Elongation factor 1-beta n=1 Tax=Daphnia galeata TaxID=27404 RepID=A0A8J2RTE7_9CRUS|nr:unnamed protein product [Daphnia galeata]
MAFGDLKTENGVKALNEFLADRSYIEGYEPSQADVTTFQALGKAPATSFPHALRWYNHIKSFGSETSKFPGAKSAAAAPASKPADDDDDDVDLFGSDDEEDEAAEKIKAERIKAYSEKKSKKPALIPKSSIVLDVKPWDDETNMEDMEKAVKSISCEGLIWGQCKYFYIRAKFVPLAYGIKKLQIGCVIEDDKVSVDWLTEEIQNFEDLVQSVDIAAFNKI